MTDRKLPEWMSSEAYEELAKQAKAPPRSHKKNVLEDNLPYLEFPGSVVYSYESGDCSFLSADLRDTLAAGSPVGFDIEWPPFTNGKAGKVALLQLCPSEKKCYLFHLSSMSGFPSGLKRLLEDETIKKVGVGIEGDRWKLMSDCDIKLSGFVELTHIANEKLKCTEKWSLDGLVKQLFKKQLLKEKSVRCSNWANFTLTEDQMKYAATDAYAGLLIYQKLESKDTQLGETVLQLDIKEKLQRVSSEVQDLLSQVPDTVSDSRGAAGLLDDVSLSLGALRSLLLGSTSKTQARVEDELDPELVMEPAAEEHSPCSVQMDYIKQRISGGQDFNNSGVDLFSNAAGGAESAKSKQKLGDSHPMPKQNAERECMMSLDITDLQMLEEQAKEEDLEDNAVLAHKNQSVVDEGADLSYVVESDEELESEMLKYLDDVDNLNRGETSDPGNKTSMQTVTPAEEEEDEGIEEEEDEWDSSIPEPNSRQIKCLKMYFGHSNFKPVQWKVVYSVLQERRDNVVVMATGYGKSLCFQFPPVYTGGIGIVVSPLISLMEDQVLQLQMSNIPACFLGSAQTENVLTDLFKGRFRVVYMTPEFCSGGTSLLQQLDKNIGITLVAVDEAHCISEWGHDFRGAYRKLGSLKRVLPNVPIVALTATASPSIRQDIVNSLHLDNPQITCTSFDRPNLFLDVHRKCGNITQDLKQFLIKKKSFDYEFEGPAIVYCPSRKVTEQVSAELSKLGINCATYHAGMGIKPRRETHHKFMRDEIQCVVATVAFGMGINKADIRKVIHYGAPKEMEAYYQEIGRAGRDGLPSACHVVWGSGDMALNRHLLSGVKSDKFRGYKMKMMAKMEKYLSSPKCRRKIILSHFEDKQLRKASLGIMGTDKCCDNCSSRLLYDPSADDTESNLQDFGKEAYQLMSAVTALGEKFGTAVPVLFLRGSYTQRLPDRFRKLPLFGCGKNIPETWWKALGRQLITEGYMKENSGQTKFSITCGLDQKGRTWLSKANDESHRTLLLQPNTELCARFFTVPNRYQAPSSAASPAPSSTHPSGAEPPKSQISQFAFPERERLQRTSTPTKAGLQISAFKSPPKTAPSQPPPPTVCPRELELQGVLYGKLVAGRQKLANEKDVPPAVLATNKILLDLAKIRPTTVENMKRVDGVSEAKSSMLAPLLVVISEFCQSEDLEANTFSSPSGGIERKCPPGMSSSCSALPDSVRITYNLFQQQGLSLRKVADSRSLPVSVVGSHLSQALKIGYPLDTERAGLTPQTQRKITDIIRSSPINSDLSRQKAIRDLVPQDIESYLISLTIALLQKQTGSGQPGQQSTGQSGPKQGPSNSVSQQQKVVTVKEEALTWIEAEEKPVKKSALTSLMTKCQPEQGYADEIEDDLLSDIPMPVRPESCTKNRDGPSVPALKAGSQKAALGMASWNQGELDEDTQELFGDSQSQNFSQPAKRKLPAWFNASKGSSSSSTATKKAKTKKGLFM
ncbi:bifunctional 3'-5' exonuclease/ATP-dependent helicase WRN isoform X1 [Acipenser ruthenus]|uniref:bifunctional 3'-5' exonuclease/ATP-dependent helicase WRN isoform X1 n=1 Tax=Acipenser ruthenus TaxID=7906 RepID=UPI002741804B|nr:bifunctional 3'-5' exonuclease/ATP-dependent helicase WRN isoform X1 [Acipenser ruthenus]